MRIALTVSWLVLLSFGPALEPRAVEGKLVNKRSRSAVPPQRRWPDNQLIQPVVIGVTSYNPDVYSEWQPEPYYYAHTTNFSTLYFLVSFSAPVKVNQAGGTPYLRLNTGAHFEAGATYAAAPFIGGGVGESKSFWRNDQPNPLRTGDPPPCRAGSVRNATDHGAFVPTPEYAAHHGRAGPEFCVFPGEAELRREQSMDHVLAFAYDVGPGDRSCRLDAAARHSLHLNGSIVHASSDVTWEPTDSQVVADVALPHPGDPLKGTIGAVQSLSANKHLVVGPAYVTNVTADMPSGVYGYQPGYSIANGAVSSQGDPDIVHVIVTFSEPVSVICNPPPPNTIPVLDVTVRLYQHPDTFYGLSDAPELYTGLGDPRFEWPHSSPPQAWTRDSTGWRDMEQYPGKVSRMCPDIFVVLRTREEGHQGPGCLADSDDDGDEETQGSASVSNGVGSRIGQAEAEWSVDECEQSGDTRGGQLGTVQFPTGFLLHTGDDPSHTLTFRYVVRRGDSIGALQYDGRDALKVQGTSRIVRSSDRAVAGVRLPPTRWDGPEGIDHPNSLAGSRTLAIRADF